MRALVLVPEPGWLKVRELRAEARAAVAAKRTAEATARDARRARLAALGRPVRVALVGCGRSKRPGRHAARDLYTGSLFRAALAHAERTADEVFILSAFHGVVKPDDMIDCYDRNLAELTFSERDGWAARINNTLRALYNGLDVEIAAYAGADYAEPIAGLTLDRGSRITVSLPLRGLGVGARLGWFARERERSGAPKPPPPPMPSESAGAASVGRRGVVRGTSERAHNFATATQIAQLDRASGAAIPVMVGRPRCNGYVAVPGGQVVKGRKLDAATLGTLDAQRLAAAGAQAAAESPAEEQRPAARTRRCKTRRCTARVAEGTRCAACLARQARRADAGAERQAERAREAETRRTRQLNRDIERRERERRSDAAGRAWAERYAAEQRAGRRSGIATHCSGWVAEEGQYYPAAECAALDAQRMAERMGWPLPA